MTNDGSEDAEEEQAHFARLEAELSRASRGWTAVEVVRTYKRGPDGDEDYEDDALIFEGHGYDHSAEREGPTLTATFWIGDDDDDDPSTIVRVYKGKQQADAVALFEADAADLASDGYSPMSQSWAAGQWGCGAFLVALVLCVILIGILVFIYMLLVKPEGTLTVTYRNVEAEADRSKADSRDPVELIERLGSLRDRGLITPEEFETKKAELLARM